MKKRGFFFIADSFTALIIITIGVVLITIAYISAREPSQVNILADNIIEFLSSKKIKDLNDPYAGIGGDLWNQGVIQDEETTLLQQIGIFYANNDDATAEEFIEAITKDVVPSQFSYEFWMNNERLYPLNPGQEHTNSRASSSLLTTSETIAFGILNKQTGDLWGPYKAEVRLWER